MSEVSEQYSSVVVLGLFEYHGSKRGTPWRGSEKGSCSVSLRLKGGGFTERVSLQGSFGVAASSNLVQTLGDRAFAWYDD